MPNTITLPDHISFEEIALKWCEWRKGGNSYLSFNKSSDGIEVTFSMHDLEYDLSECLPIALFVISEKKFIIEDGEEKKFQPILDFIKEKSNG